MISRRFSQDARKQGWVGIVIALLFFPSLSSAQYYQADFPPEEFRARWQEVFDRIGDDAVALVQGYSQTNGFAFPSDGDDVDGDGVPDAVEVLRNQLHYLLR